MVAAAKLRRAREQAEAARPYADKMAQIVVNLSHGLEGSGLAPTMLAGNGRDDTCLLVLMTSDRGLCGGFNGTLIKTARMQITRWQQEGKTVKLLCVGKKGYDVLRRQYGSLMLDPVLGISKRKITYADAEAIAADLTARFEAEEFDRCTLLYGRFVSAITQDPILQQLIPLNEKGAEAEAEGTLPLNAAYEYEPEAEELLETLLPQNLSMQVYKALLENSASEQGARMTAMDNATRNAGDMIGRLTLQYNRSRQAQITKELIEIISGAEAI